MNTGHLNGNSLYGNFSFYFHHPKTKFCKESLRELHGIREGGCLEQVGGGKRVLMKQSH